MTGERKRVVIIGGGIAGLATACRLQQQSRQRNLSLDITLLERELRLGGKIISVHEDDCVIEGGPDSFIASKPHALQLCEELGIADRLVGTNDAQKRTYIYSRGRLHDLPAGLSGLVPSRIAPILRSSLISPIGKARLLMDFVLPAQGSHGDESVAHFMSRRLGREAFERLIEPLMGGIYAGDTNQLSLNATFPQLRQLELAHGSLLRGVMRRPPAPMPQRWTGFVSLRGGLQDLVNALQQHLRIDLQCGRSVRAVQRASNAFVVQTDAGAMFADGVIISTPAYVTASLLQELDADLADAHRAIPHVSTATITLAFRRAQIAQPLHGFGFVIPSVERRRSFACTWSSNKFPHRAPDDLVLLRCFIGRAGQAGLLERDDHALTQIARAELRAILQIEVEPLLKKIFRWPQGMPQYNLGHLERVAQIEAALQKYPGLFVAGAAYRGVGIPDCIRSANEAASAVMKFLCDDEDR